MLSYKVDVKENIIQKNRYYNDQLILKYTIKYPEFISETFHKFLMKLNFLYKTQALMYEKFHIEELYQLAMEEYENSIANDYPIRQYEVYTDYNVTYNQNCALSLYLDKYEYTGGAHGNTIRNSDTWDLKEGCRIVLSELFPNESNYKEFLVNTIYEQIENAIQSGNNIYFEDYTTLVPENFKEENFYLTDEGVVIYFQHYDIAPYASGIPTFVIPYSPGAVIAPEC